MGEMAELLQDQEEMEYYKTIDAIEREYGKGLWTTKTGKTIKIQDMEISHIQNTINYMKKNKDFLYYIIDDFDVREEKIKELKEELDRRKK